MKKVFFWALLLLCFSVSAVPDTTKIPQTWKNESVIILNYTFEYTINKERFGYYSSGDLKDEEHLAITYYVRDKWGVNELSTISLPSEIAESDYQGDRVGNIYKRNGTVVPLTKDYLSNYESSAELMRNGRVRKLDFSFSKSKKSKLAVPNLEPGDILEIDVTIKTRNVPGILLLQNEFPVLKYAYYIETSGIMAGGGNININGKMINADYPTLSTGNNYRLEIDSVEKSQNEILNDDLKQTPYVILDYITGSSYITDRGVDYTAFTAGGEGGEKLQRGIVIDLTAQINPIFVTRIKAALNKKYPKITDTIAFVKDAFYFYRELDIVSALYDKKGDANDEMFVATISSILFDYKIKHKVFLTQPDYYGSLSDKRHLYEGIKGIQITGSDICLFHPNYALEPGSIPSYFENQEMVVFTSNKYYRTFKYRWWPFWTGLFVGGQVALTLDHPVLGIATALSIIAISPIVYGIKKSHAKKYCRFDLAKEKLPHESVEKNRTELSYEIKLVPGETNLAEIKKETNEWGKSKAAEMRDICRRSTIYFGEVNDYQKLLGLTKPVKLTDLEKADEEKSMKVEMKKEIDDIGLSVKEFKSYKIDDFNFFDKSKPIKLTQNFTLSNISWNYGDYIIIEAGKFIGEQLRVPDDNKERTQDFYIPFQKSSSNVISIIIPDGYVVQNQNEFDFSKTTPAGEFTSSGKVDGNKFVITTSKKYLFQFYSKEKANDIYSFLKEADNFWGKKLILKKRPDLFSPVKKL